MALFYRLTNHMPLLGVEPMWTWDTFWLAKNAEIRQHCSLAKKAAISFILRKSIARYCEYTVLMMDATVSSFAGNQFLSCSPVLAIHLNTDCMNQFRLNVWKTDYWRKAHHRPSTLGSFSEPISICSESETCDCARTLISRDNIFINSPRPRIGRKETAWSESWRSYHEGTCTIQNLEIYMRKIRYYIWEILEFSWPF
jgi:hypothetical protein